MKQAIIAIEDRRFYTNAGIDVRGIGRALYQDIRAQGAVQGGSTITMQFVKNALAAQDERTLFQKLREAAIAYEITRKWSKERILRNYLNTIYFGNGAYGIESAARTYFGAHHPGCGEDGEPDAARRCSSPARPRCSPAWSPPRAATTRSPTARPPASAATSCSSGCSSRATSREPSSARTRSRVAARRSSDIQPAGRGHGATRTSRRGSSSRSSTSSAAARTARGARSRAG